MNPPAVAPERIAVLRARCDYAKARQDFERYVAATPLHSCDARSTRWRMFLDLKKVMDEAYTAYDNALRARGVQFANQRGELIREGSL